MAYCSPRSSSASALTRRDSSSSEMLEMSRGNIGSRAESDTNFTLDSKNSSLGAPGEAQDYVPVIPSAVSEQSSTSAEATCTEKGDEAAVPGPLELAPNPRQ